jgi:hypothetical protein
MPTPSYRRSPAERENYLPFLSIWQPAKRLLDVRTCGLAEIVRRIGELSQIGEINAIHDLN